MRTTCSTILVLTSLKSLLSPFLNSFRKLTSNPRIDAGFQHVERPPGNGPPLSVTDITASCEFDHRSREESLVLKYIA